MQTRKTTQEVKMNINKLIYALNYKNRFYLLLEQGIKTYHCKVDTDTLAKAVAMATDHIDRFPKIRHFNMS